MTRALGQTLVALAGAGALAGLLVLRRAGPPPEIVQLETNLQEGTIVADGQPHSLCVFAVYRNGGVALPAFERVACDSLYRATYSQVDRRVSARAQAQADSLCFQFHSRTPGITFLNHSCAGHAPARVWHITVQAAVHPTP